MISSSIIYLPIVLVYISLNVNSCIVSFYLFNYLHLFLQIDWNREWNESKCIRLKDETKGKNNPQKTKYKS